MIKYILYCIGILAFINSTVFSQNNTTDPPLVPFSNGINFGFKDSLTKKIHIMPVYNGASFFYGRYAKVKVNGKWGVINKKGEHIIEMKYDSVVMLRNNIFLCYQKNMAFLLSEKQDTIGVYDNFLQLEDNTGITGAETFPAITRNWLGNDAVYVVNNRGTFYNIIRTDTVKVEHGDGLTSKYFIEKKVYPYIVGGTFCVLNAKAEPITISGLQGVKFHVKTFTDAAGKNALQKQILVDISDRISVENSGMRYIDLAKPVYININGKWQVINSSGKVLSVYQFDQIEVENNLVAGYKGKEKYTVSEVGKITRIK